MIKTEDMAWINLHVAEAGFNHNYSLEMAFELQEIGIYHWG
jgi:sialic acid synthase SpsE